MRKKTLALKLPLNVPSKTTFVLYDPKKKYCLDHFGSKAVMALFWESPWKKPQRGSWKNLRERLIGLRFDGKRKPRLLQVYFYKFWEKRDL